MELSLVQAVRAQAVVSAVPGESNMWPAIVTYLISVIVLHYLKFDEVETVAIATGIVVCVYSLMNKISYGKWNPF